MADLCIALDIGTSGLRCQAIDMSTGGTVSTAITQHHPIPGMNVIDHVNFAIKNGRDTATGLLREAVANLFRKLDVDLDSVKRVGVCGNTFQMSLFEGIEIRDLAYAGKKALESMGVKPVERDGAIYRASDLGFGFLPNAEIVIPPSVTHEIGGDAIAMLKMTPILDEKEPVIMVDYGTNAEMALVVDGHVYTGSAAAGPALEGQEIGRGMLAAPGAISDVEIVPGGWKLTVLDASMCPSDGDTVDPLTGEVVVEGKTRAVGITGTGVVAVLACGLSAGLINPPEILTPDEVLHLQDGIDINSHDIEEAGKAIGALRAGFLTLMDAAGIWVDDLKKAYMSGASGLYVDAAKALSIGMVAPGADRLIQFGNTSIEMARRMALGTVDLDTLRGFAKELRADHVMFATSEMFKNLYSIEYSIWCTGLPADQYNDMLNIYGIRHICEPAPKVEVRRMVRTDLPDTEGREVFILDDCGTTLEGILPGCRFCRRCEDTCPEHALFLVRKNGSTVANIRTDLCGGSSCMRCVRICPDRVMKHDLLSIAART